MRYGRSSKRDPADLPVVILAKIASYLLEDDIFYCCHVNRKWYQTFNKNYIFKNTYQRGYEGLVSDIEEKSVIRLITKEIDAGCTEMQHCDFMRDYIIKVRVIKKILEKTQKVLAHNDKIIKNLQKIQDKLLQQVQRNESL